MVVYRIYEGKSTSLEGSFGNLMMESVEVGNNLIFVLGIMQRSGTNYLNNLLLLHTDCDYPGFVWEDYLVAPAKNLEKYVQTVYQNWHPSWRNDIEERMGNNSLMNCIGEGLNQFMKRQYDSSIRNGLRTPRKPSTELNGYPRLVTATPSVDSVDCFFRLFPSASLLIVIRDGRAVVESGMKSFNWDFEQSVRRWADAACRIRQFEGKEKNGRFLIVKYEDIFSDTDKELRRILTFLGLDIETYDFKAAGNLGVTGSSELQEREGHIHWNTRKKNKDFNPLERWSHWRRFQHERFNWLAGEYLEQFGYVKRQYKGQSTVWNVWNMILDRLYKIEVWTSKKALLLRKPVSQLRMLLYSLPDRFRNPS